MADLKISDMTYAAVEETFMIPAVNPSSLSTNYYILAGMINFQRIFRWNSSTIYLADDLVIYNSSTVKGTFRVTTTTSAGDSPEGTGANKFKSQSLEFVANTCTFSADGAGTRVNLDDKRTVIATINTSMTGTYNFWFDCTQSVTNKNIVLTINGGSGYSIIGNIYKNGANTFLAVIDTRSNTVSSGDCKLEITING